MKRNCFLALLLIIVIILSLSFVACKKENNDDSNYSIEIYGINEQPITVTKSQIKEIGKTKEVVYTAENPCYASDKTDKEGNLIPVSLKGVYLDDVLEVYASGAVSGAYSSMTLKAHDGYASIITQQTYSVEHGGTKMIIAYEYDGVVLNENEKSGALRAVFPDKEKNSWTSKLKSIHFNNQPVTLPEVRNLTFIEALESKYYSSFEKQETTGDNTIDYTYYGLSLNALFEDSVLTATQSDNMYFTAWDYVSDGTNSFYKDYSGWRSYEFYENAFLIYSFKENDEEIQDYDLRPRFDGDNIRKGMSIKNVLSLSVGEYALVSLDISFEKFVENQNDYIMLQSVLEHINMYKEQISYKAIDIQGNEVALSKEQINTATIAKNGDNYVLNYGENTLQIKSITQI